jgi:hypothetical protein
MEMDSMADCADVNRGCSVLIRTEIGSGWTEFAPLTVGESIAGKTLDRLSLGLPIPLRAWTLSSMGVSF